MVGTEKRCLLRAGVRLYSLAHGCITLFHNAVKLVRDSVGTVSARGGGGL